MQVLQNPLDGLWNLVGLMLVLQELAGNPDVLARDLALGPYCL